LYFVKIRAMLIKYQNNKMAALRQTADSAGNGPYKAAGITGNAPDQRKEGFCKSLCSGQNSGTTGDEAANLKWGGRARTTYG
jgi:hypothetical protein